MISDILHFLKESVLKFINLTYPLVLSFLLLLTSWQPVLRYGESVFTKQSQGTEFFVLVALLCKFWSTSKLCIYRYLPATSSANSLSHERYSFKYTASDKTNGL